MEDDERSPTKKRKEIATLQDFDPIIPDSSEQTPTSNKKGFPKYVGFIIGMEFCERFCFYGLRTVLILYLRQYLKWNDHTATALSHAFVVVAYFFPVVGGIVADSCWGRKKTIFRLSLVYVGGIAILTVASIPYISGQGLRVFLTMFGLFWIAVGTGGIKPCVSTFGGDQFSTDQARYRNSFFLYFYVAINAGGLLSTVLVPIFRADVDCYPNKVGNEFESCYALSFGVPGVLMVVALVLFLLGNRWYVIFPPEGSVFVRFCQCIYSAVRNKWVTPVDQRNKSHWIEYSDAPDKMKRDAKYTLQIALLLVPVPFFWALFDQMGTRWTLQAIYLDGKVGHLTLKPDQVQILNPIFILTLIPLFDKTLYPFLEFINVNFSSLRRMTAGLLLTGISFIAAAILQIVIERGETTLPTTSQYGVRFINSLPCNINVSLSTLTSNQFITINSQEASEINIFPVVDDMKYKYETCSTPSSSANGIVKNVEAAKVKDLFVHEMFHVIPTSMHMVTQKTENAGSRFSVINLSKDEKYLTFEDSNYKKFDLDWKERTGSLDVVRGKHKIKVYDDSVLLYEYEFEAEVGAVYTLVADSIHQNTYLVRDMNPNTVNVVWVLPQYIIVTVGEIFISVTGLDFCYSQAPPSMKSVLASVWLLTVSFGNLIVLIVAEARLVEHQSTEFILFSVLVFLAAIVFIILAIRYKPVDEDEFAQEIKEELEKQSRAQ